MCRDILTYFIGLPQKSFFIGSLCSLYVFKFIHKFRKNLLSISHKPQPMWPIWKNDFPGSNQYPIAQTGAIEIGIPIPGK